jgi:hypothetical protein
MTLNRKRLPIGLRSDTTNIQQPQTQEAHRKRRIPGQVGLHSLGISYHYYAIGRKAEQGDRANAGVALSFRDVSGVRIHFRSVAHL